jgi:hypothetical protein
MYSRIKRAALILALASALSACTNPFQWQLVPPTGGAPLNHAPSSPITLMDETPPPCTTTCDSDGGLPGRGGGP